MLENDILSTKIKIFDVIEENNTKLEFIRSYFVIKSESYIQKINTDDVTFLNIFFDDLKLKYREIEKLVGGI